MQLNQAKTLTKKLQELLKAEDLFIDNGAIARLTAYQIHHTADINPTHALHALANL